MASPDAFLKVRVPHDAYVHGVLGPSKQQESAGKHLRRPAHVHCPMAGRQRDHRATHCRAVLHALDTDGMLQVVARAVEMAVRLGLFFGSLAFDKASGTGETKERVRYRAAQLR